MHLAIHFSTNHHLAAGRHLNEDLAQSAWSGGPAHLLLEADFPWNYPQQPFSLRLVKPRCMWCAN